MNKDNPILFVEINENNYIFVAGVYDESQNLVIVEKVIAKCSEFKKNKFVNINDGITAIRKNVEIIENKLKYVFRDVTIIIDDLEYSCLNISGFKKLNGSQVLKENISYILNSIKLAVSENEINKNILHIFNSKSCLDGNNTENLPIGSFGNFYNHELTFFLIGNNDLKNINQIFNKSNLAINKVFLKSFTEGVQLVNQKKIETFFKININQETSKVIFFDQASFRYSEQFNFGTNIIFKDIEKICSINNKTIVDFLSNSINKDNNYSDNDFLEEKYFTKKNFRKIRKKLIIDIADARINELVDIILNKNINTKSFKSSKFKIYFTVKDELIIKNFQKNLDFYFTRCNNSESSLIKDFETDSSIINISNLLVYGWKKEAIPTIQIKNSLITRIFKFIFG